MRNILLVENNLSDAEFIEQVFSDINISISIFGTNTPELLTNFLKTHLFEKNRIIPDLIIINTNSYFIEILDMIKSENALRRIPVIIFLSSSEKEYVTKCYSHFANAVIIKPTEKERFKEIINEIDNFWFHRTRLSSIPK